MADWRDIAKDNFDAGTLLVESKQYRSAVSRLYYAAFALLTDELLQRNAAAEFANVRGTPGHTQLPDLTEKWFTHFSEERRRNLARRVVDLYRARLEADYAIARVDKESAQNALRLTRSVFKYLNEQT